MGAWVTGEGMTTGVTVTTGVVEPETTSRKTFDPNHAQGRAGIDPSVMNGNPRQGTADIGASMIFAPPGRSISWMSGGKSHQP